MKTCKSELVDIGIGPANCLIGRAQRIDHALQEKGTDVIVAIQEIDCFQRGKRTKGELDARIPRCAEAPIGLLQVKHLARVGGREVEADIMCFRRGTTVVDDHDREGELCPLRDGGMKRLGGQRWLAIGRYKNDRAHFRFRPRAHVPSRFLQIALR